MRQTQLEQQKSGLANQAIAIERLKLNLYDEQLNRLKLIESSKKQYIKQEGSCAICGHCLSLKSSHIDHIQPLSAHPHLAIDTSNLQLLCRECNQKKSNKV